MASCILLTRAAAESGSCRSDDRLSGTGVICPYRFVTPVTGKRGPFWLYYQLG